METKSQTITKNQQQVAYKKSFFLFVLYACYALLFSKAQGQYGRDANLPLESDMDIFVCEAHAM